VEQGNEFDTDEGGRGDSYRESQLRPDVRLTGIRTLLQRALDGPLSHEQSPTLRVLDVLGGDGTLARAVSHLMPHVSAERQWILTGDLSRHMVAGALGYGLPAICQPAQRLALRDETFDAVILAYGTHHIPVNERKAAYAEAWRVLRPGGRIVVHDFEDDGVVSAWFSNVVHKYAPNGHAYDHFSRQELTQDLSTVGFRRVSVEGVSDPFTISAPRRTTAIAGMCSYVFNMYGLFGLADGATAEQVHNRVWELINDHMRYAAGQGADGPLAVTVRETGSATTVTMPRVALAAVGVK
jgi:ubiquinone/menaquinone biosynthesis C-methylase UbiE